MDRTEAKITDAELEVMGALWSGAGPMTLSQLKDALARSQGWSGDTTKTLLRRLCGKGAVEQEKREVYYYRPLVSRDELGSTRLGGSSTSSTPAAPGTWWPPWWSMST